MKLKKLIISLAVIIAGFTGAMAQEKITVSGTVSDNMGPVAGVGVMQKGTTNGVATDMDGRYSITVPSGSILVFESIGYTTQEITATRPQIDVVLTEDLRCGRIRRPEKERHNRRNLQRKVGRPPEQGHFQCRRRPAGKNLRRPAGHHVG